MARLPRLFVPGAVHYLAQRPASGRVLVVDADDGASFLDLLEAACRRHGFALHAYALTPSAIHLLGTPAGPTASAGVLQTIGRVYVPRINRKFGRSGALWDRRYRSTIVDPEWLLTAMRVVETDTDGHAGLAWSSRDHHTGVRQDAFVTDHARYWALSDTPFGRQAAYRSLTNTALEPGAVDRVRHAVEHGWALGSPAFLREVDDLANRRTAPLPRGRPRKRHEASLIKDDVVSEAT